MNLGDLKMYVINLSTFAISMSQVDTILKIVLLVISIGYTLHRWYFEIKNKKNNKKK
jgi:hypothetical protein|tara:strand:- start:1559 stop:1729 length:171 start_codon:yes stop_codon:yes gene_type:complete